MGVPKFFRWISERYPKINQPLHHPPNMETVERHFGEVTVITDDDDDDDKKTKSNKKGQLKNNKKRQMQLKLEEELIATQKNSIVPEFDRLYLDMNGIIHCCSHNNAEEDDSENSNSSATAEELIEKINNGGITEEEIFRNICYYLDRVITDIAQPKDLVYMAIDGVAPRAKLNQQRSRRYRSGQTEKEIEATLLQESNHPHFSSSRHHGTRSSSLNQHSPKSHEELFHYHEDFADIYDYDPSPFNHQKSNQQERSDATPVKVKEVEPGRYSGIFETTSNNNNSKNVSHQKEIISLQDNDHYDDEDEDSRERKFHSNVITPGTPFFDRCTAHIRHFVQYKLHTDPKWKHLTIIFSGPNVPGEGEHKIMDFIRRQKLVPNYNPNTRHCLLGQDGDLIMLGLATHEPHFCLLREEVVFDESRMRRRKDKTLKFIPKKAKDNTDDTNSSHHNHGRSTLTASIDTYMHNPNFELLHMSTLRDYLAYEFETQDVIPESPFELEPTIDDFVFMTFFVGNDFLPHMPALDIADEAFDLLFYTYKRNRYKWLSNNQHNRNEKYNNQQQKEKGYDHHPYLTNAGDIVSGSRLEMFISDLGMHEDPYYDNKKKSELERNEMIRNSDIKAGRDMSIPSVEALEAKEASDRANYKEMLTSIELYDGDSSAHTETSTVKSNLSSEFTPVLSSGELPSFSTSQKETASKVRFKPDESSQLEEGFLKKLANIVNFSISSTSSEKSNNSNNRNNISKRTQRFDSSDDPDLVLEEDNELNVSDIKGRYYWDKFKFTPIDEEKHLELRKSYIEGLVWNLNYYYKGCVSWDWFYPYHYGPMLSDLVNLDDILLEISFDGKMGEPLKPYEQLMGCLPPSSAYLLPKPYRWLMRSPSSPIIEFYPDSFVVDMNGKRWPWEAVVLLPFIDSKRLIDAARKHVGDDMLTEEEIKCNMTGTAEIFIHDKMYKTSVPGVGSLPLFSKIENCNVRALNYEDSQWHIENEKVDPVFQPKLLPKTKIPYPGYPTLKEAPVQGLKRWKIGINIFGMKSRYRTAILKMEDELPAIPPASVLGPKFIGTTVYFRYPFFQEGFVTAVSDSEITIRGKQGTRKWSKDEQTVWMLKKQSLIDQYSTGEGITGTGGWSIPSSDVVLSIRPLKGIETMSDGTKVKVYAKAEVEVPFIAALWSPSRPDPRFLNKPARLEKDPYKFTQQSKPTAVLMNSSIRNKYKPFNPLRPPENISLTSPAKNASQTIGILPPSHSPREAIKVIGGNVSTRGIFTNPDWQRQKGTKSFSTMPSKTLYRQGISRPRVAVTFAVAAVTFLSSGFVVQASGDRTPSLSKYPLMMSSESSNLPFVAHENTNKLIECPREEEEFMDENNFPPPRLQFAHGTTTLAFTFNGGIVAAVDSRASIGSFVGSKTTQKVLPVSSKILGTMAGGAADCSFWIRKLQAEAKVHELMYSKTITVARASTLLADALYGNRGLNLSVGTMIMGFDDQNGASIYYIDDTGVRIKGNMFSVGSGSTYALGILDTEKRKKLSEDEAILLGIKAIRHATFRDAYSGGYIAVYVITSGGWKKVFSEDLALTSKNRKIDQE